MNIALLVGDHAFGAPRSRLTVGTKVAGALADHDRQRGTRHVLVDRYCKGPSRRVASLASSSLIDCDRIRSRCNGATMYLTMSVCEFVGAGTNPWDWARRVDKIRWLCKSLCWDFRLVEIVASEHDPKEVRRFSARIDKALDGLDRIQVSTEGWTEFHDPGNEGVNEIASAVLADMDVRSAVSDPSHQSSGAPIGRPNVLRSRGRSNT